MTVVAGSVATRGSVAHPTPTGVGQVRGAAHEISQSHKWWTSKVGPLLGATYLSLTLFPLPIGTALGRLTAMLWSACLLATAAYVINDWTDREVDRRAGKTSRVMALRPQVVAALLAGLVVAGVLPWAFIGLPAAGWVALAAIVLLPYAYSQPPIRWKERGALGLLADTGLAHLSPTVFALAAFDGLQLDEGTPEAVVGVALVVWSAVVGLRGIIDHEVADADADRRAGTRTWVVAVGEERARRAAGVALAVEVAALVAITASLLTVAPVTGGLLVATAVVALAARLLGVWTRPLLAIGDGDVVGVLWLSYAFWLPVALLIGLVWREPALTPLLLGHIALFWPVALPWTRNVAGYATAGLKVATVGSWHRLRGTSPFARAWRWLRHRLPDHLRRAWYDGIRPFLHSRYHAVRNSLVRRPLRHRVARQGRRFRRLAGRVTGRPVATHDADPADPTGPADASDRSEP